MELVQFIQGVLVHPELSSADAAFGELCEFLGPSTAKVSCLPAHTRAAGVWCQGAIW